MQFMEIIQAAVQDELELDYVERETRPMRWLLAEAHRGRGPQQDTAPLILLVTGPGRRSAEVVAVLLDQDGLPRELA
jgi:hypothetical protein